jgi:outer membrane lipoprotein LolB
VPPPTRHPAAHLLLACLVATLLAGCAGRERAAVPELGPAARLAALQSLATWEARGRIALKMTGTSGQGTFAWSQAGDRTVLRVTGPFGSGASEVRWEPTRLQVLSGRGKVEADYPGPDAARQFLEAQLGWSLPIGNARHWLLGLPGPGSPAVTTDDGAGRLATLVQDGWEVRYDDYRTEAGLALPRKVVLESPAGRIRLVIDGWQF